MSTTCRNFAESTTRPYICCKTLSQAKTYLKSFFRRILITLFFMSIFGGWWEDWQLYPKHWNAARFNLAFFCVKAGVQIHRKSFFPTRYIFSVLFLKEKTKPVFAKTIANYFRSFSELRQNILRSCFRQMFVIPFFERLFLNTYWHNQPLALI